MQRRFVSDVSHELRTPLTTVRMAADVIHDARERLRPGDRALRRAAAGPARPFRVAARRPAGDQPVRRGRRRRWTAEPIDLREVVRRVVDAAEPLAERKGSRVRGPRRRAAGDRRGRRRAGSSGCCAIWWSTPSSTARAGTWWSGSATADGAVAVGVRDYGVGLKPGEATRVFNRFWRADPARARTTGGTGLGLSIAVEDARLHGGWLQAWGEPGGGSQFRLTLPRTAGEPLRGSPIPLEPEDSRRNRERPRGRRRPAAPAERRCRPQSGAGRRFRCRPAAAAPRDGAADPTALPGSGARVVPRRPASRRGSGTPRSAGSARRSRPQRKLLTREDTARGR